jgi:hypothetical protein
LRQADGGHAKDLLRAARPNSVDSRKCRDKPKFQSSAALSLPNSRRCLPDLSGEAALDGHADKVEIALD